ncbi:hypothetical protein D3C71_1986980 [compost metagenome]
MPHEFAHSFRNQALAPVRNADPIGNFTFLFTDLEMAVATDENTDTPYRTAVLLQLKRIRFWVVEDGANDLGTVLDTGVLRPTRYGADSVVFGVFV